MKFNPSKFQVLHYMRNTNKSQYLTVNVRKLGIKQIHQLLFTWFFLLFIIILINSEVITLQKYDYDTNEHSKISVSRATFSN